MEYALGLFIFWAVLFFPLGLAIHWLVLGVSARLQAVPLALLSGIAAAIVLLGATRQAGIESGDPVLATVFFIAAITACIAIWRGGVRWRSRGLIGVGFALFAAVVAIQMPVWEGSTSGPLGYGSGREPVLQIATIDGAISKVDGGSTLVEAARRSQHDRFTGFEQFAALTVATGQPDRADQLRVQRRELDQARASGREVDSINETASGWSTYTLHPLIGGMFAALVLLPLWVLARWRGVGWLGTIAIVLFGVLSPAVMLALGLAQASGVVATPFAVAAVVSLLIARRDRGWYALAALHAAAVLVILGPVGVVPIALVGGSWLALRGDTREHLKQTDAPTTKDRPIVFAALVGMLALYGTASAILHSPGLRWTPLHDSLAGAILSWPFTWMGGELGGTAPATIGEVTLWLIGPALLAIGIAYSVARREVREVAITVGVLVSVLSGVLVAVFDPHAGRSLVEYSWLVGSPLLAFVVVRMTGLARELGRERNTGPLAGIGPLVMLTLFGLFSVACAAVSGTRMTHAPALPVPPASTGMTLVAAGDPWLAYMLPVYERVRGGGIVDADALAPTRNRFASDGLVFGRYGAALLDPSPFASDPPDDFIEYSQLDSSGTRLFINNSQTRADARAAARADAPAPGTSIRASDEIARQHDPVGARPAAGNVPGGLIVPATPIAGCAVGSPRPCEPRKPVASGNCTNGDITAGTTILPSESTGDGRSAGAAATGSGFAGRDGSADATAESDGAEGRAVPAAFGAGAGRGAGGALDHGDGGAGEEAAPTESDPATLAQQILGVMPRNPTMLGIACWEVELDDASRFLTVHERDIGLVLSPREAVRSGGDDNFTQHFFAQSPLATGDELRTSDFGASATYGDNVLAEVYDLSFEGAFAGGAEFYTVTRGSSGGTDSQEMQFDAFKLNGEFGPWSRVYRNLNVFGGIEVVNSSGTDMRFGRVVARPADLARSCTLVVPAVAGARVEMQTINVVTRQPDPGLVVSVSRIDPGRGGGHRTAHLVLASYLQRSGSQRYVLADWTEQYTERPAQAACTGFAAAPSSANAGATGGIGNVFSDGAAN